MPSGSVYAGRPILAYRHRKALRRKSIDIVRGAARTSDEWFAYFNVRPVASQFRWAPDRRLMMPLVSIVGPSSRYYTPSLSGPYRESVYGGPPSKYVDVTRALASNGAGTSVDPWNLDQAEASALAGDIVGWSEGLSVDIDTTNDDNVPAFNPASPGSVGSRIVHVTKYAGVSLSTPESNGNGTRIAHSGSIPTMSPVGGSGCATLGGNGVDYITYDGQILVPSECWPKADSGMLRTELAQGIVFKNIEIVNTYGLLPLDNNGVALRGEQDDDTVFDNIRITGWRTTQTGGSLNQPGYCGMLYASHNFRLSHIEMVDCDGGLFPKGSANAATRWNYGTIEYCLHDNVDVGMRINDLDPDNDSTIRYNVWKNYKRWGLCFSSETGVALQNLTVHHNTVAKGDTSGGNFTGAFYMKQDTVQWEVATTFIRDNLLDAPSGQEIFNAGECSLTFPTTNYNGYYRGGDANPSFSYNGTGYSAIGTWRTNTGQEANSQYSTIEPFNNRGTEDLSIVSGHAFLTASSTGGPLGYQAGSETPGVVV